MRDGGKGVKSAYRGLRSKLKENQQNGELERGDAKHRSAPSSPTTGKRRTLASTIGAPVASYRKDAAMAFKSSQLQRLVNKILFSNLILWGCYKCLKLIGNSSEFYLYRKTKQNVDTARMTMKKTVLLLRSTKLFKLNTKTPKVCSQSGLQRLSTDIFSRPCQVLILEIPQAYSVAYWLIFADGFNLRTELKTNQKLTFGW